MLPSDVEGETLHRLPSQKYRREQLSDVDLSSSDIFVTNPNVHIEGLFHFDDFISPEEEASIIAFLDIEESSQDGSMDRNGCSGIRSKWVKDAFSKRRSQVYRRQSDSDSVLNQYFDRNWKWLMERIFRVHPGNLDSVVSLNQVQVEEITGTSPSGPNILEDCYGDLDEVYEVYLNASPGILVSYRLPIERKNDCWELTSDNKVYVKQRSMVVRTGDCLLNWRRNISTANKDNLIWNLNGEIGTTINLRRNPEFRHICVRLRCRRNIPFLPSTSHEPRLHHRITSKTAISDFGSSLVERLTIIVTTSPIKSNPSTEMLERTFDTFILAGEDFAYKCKKIIVCKLQGMAVIVYFPHNIIDV